MDPLLHQQLHCFLETHGLIGRERAAHFVVAYSGGRDSTALLHSLSQLRQESAIDLTLTAAYYWHPWRPLQEDLKVIHQNAAPLKIQWFMLTPDLTLPKTEAAARQDRYRQLASLACDLKATALLTAHHQDDQIETILFRLFRGTGLEGVTGIPAVRPLASDGGGSISLARPFIGIPRSRINDYIQEYQLLYVEDPTNIDTRFKRNRIRHEILPAIEAAFPQARQSLIRFSDLTAGELEIIERKINAIWRELYDPRLQSMDEVRFGQLARPFQRRIVRKFLDITCGEEAGYSKIEEIIDFISGKTRDIQAPALFSLSAERFLSMYRNRISIERLSTGGIAPVKFSIPTEISHRELKATLSIVPLTSEQQAKPIDYQKLPAGEIYADLSEFKNQELVLRGRQKGDRIKPLGMDTSIRLKKFFINRSVPRFKRDAVPLLATDSEILWAVGIGLSDKIRVRNRPTHVIRFKKETSCD